VCFLVIEFCNPLKVGAVESLGAGKLGG